MELHICKEIHLLKDQTLSDLDIIDKLKLKDIPLNIVFKNIFKVNILYILFYCL